MLAFRTALAQGADALELDTRTTADDIPVILHDATLDRTTDGHGRLRGFRAVEVERLNAGAGEKIPRLAEVLEQFPDTPLILEIKESRATPAVKQLLLRHGARERVLVGGFEHAAISPFGEGWHRSASRREVAWSWTAARLGLPRWRGSYGAFTVPEYHGKLRVVDERWSRLARRSGKPVHVWTVDEVAQARRLRGIGVCGLITNLPARMKLELS